MRIRMNNAPGYGASPSSEPQYNMDGFTAAGILASAAEIRAASVALADLAAARMSDHDFWTFDLDGKSVEVKRERLAAALAEVLDDFMHQGKLEEAGEIA